MYTKNCPGPLIPSHKLCLSILAKAEHGEMSIKRLFSINTITPCGKEHVNNWKTKRMWTNAHVVCIQSIIVFPGSLATVPCTWTANGSRLHMFFCVSSLFANVTRHYNKEQRQQLPEKREKKSEDILRVPDRSPGSSCIFCLCGILYIYLIL